MTEVSDSLLIEGLKTNDFKVLNQIYANHLPRITKMIVQNKGSENDARDVFQEAIVVLFKRLNEPNFEIKSSFSNYLYGICKFIWLRQLKKKHRKEVTLDKEELLKGDVMIEQKIIETEQRQFYQEKFLELGADCQKVLQLFFDSNPLQKIAQIMGYSNEYVKRKKYKCKEKLVKLIKNDKRFAEHL